MAAGVGVSSRKRPYGLLLLLALGAALLSVALLHKLRERRVLSLLVLDQERDLLALQVLLQKERERSKRARSRLEKSRETIMFLNQQKLELQNKLMETETTVAEIKRRQKVMEGALEEKENQIEQMIQKSSESAETTNQRVFDLTQLLREKEDEIERVRKQQRPSEEDQISSSRNETWVKLETNVEDEGLRGDESGSGQDNLNAIDEHGKQEGEGREIEELQGTESTTEPGESKQELESSQVAFVHEEKTASDGVDPTTTERPKTSHRRRRGRRTKAKSRRIRESEKQETAQVEDRKEEPADGGAVNGVIPETETEAIPRENKTSPETMEIEADTKREDDNNGPKHEEAILTEEKAADSAASGDHDENGMKESNDDDPGKNSQEETAIAGHEEEA